ncbi:glycoside hydrolase family 28 protein [Roseateles cellulosilyticus]|uniref:Glycosyl hydrolase family 28 protein n=1 Tax=Pelomonas cellulosilytica TaxID=2906762 RepID=A0ABS8XTB1_9BURK|nr:glycosyl hydrolase family 28 protein [Pelomonas sp. P8]MCE4555954.1 glycosyl hydrolase family 28 protein [Pelomonas sp. P8]
MHSHKTLGQLAGLSLATLSLVLSACGGGGDNPTTAVSYDTAKPFQVGTTSFDPDLPAEPTLPTSAQVCATLEASDKYVKRPDGALPPEADPSVSGNRVAITPAVANPDQARIQAALDACGAGVDSEVGAAIASADAAATADQKAAAVANKNISGVSGEELAKPKYKASKFAVRLVVSSTGAGNAFISGPLTLPSGVTLWIDKGVTLFASRDVMLYNGGATTYCGNTQVGAKAGSSGNCKPLIGGSNLVNSAVMGDGAIDSRAYAEIVTSNRFYPMMKVDLTCSNTYAAYATSTFAADGTPCDNGGTVVDSKSTVRNMTWWDLAYLGNMVENGTTGAASQSNFRMMVFNYAKNLTLYRITLNNSANFHVVPSGIDGFTVWGVKVQTPSRAAFANPAGNGNPLYTGETFNEDNVKNTDAFDPGSAGGLASNKLTTGSTTTSAAAMSFDGYLKNVVFAYNFISTGDDDIAIKGSQNPSPKGSGLIGVDGDRDARSDRKYGFIIAHNHIYWGHGISVGSETNAGVANIHVYDNSFDGAEEALRIKSDYARGGEVYNVTYTNICARNTLNALLFTPYYSTKALPSSGPLIPNFHDITINNMLIEGSSKLRFEGFQANTGGLSNPANPLVMALNNVIAAKPDAMSVTASDAKLTLKGTNLPLVSDADRRIEVTGQATQAVDASKVIDCSKAYVDFPTLTSPGGTSW